ncbi:hypothetical protein HPB47_007470 [Ixodes persulcatus]|uniref:Uncharacterized protein n=1 Tax=Ixodes persulcatus TaxID=34615 RepID=A0AC60P853_IXOPE|nr:hypothetical protein HPB47_007470 [Ixodes persulcatus]
MHLKAPVRLGQAKIADRVTFRKEEYTDETDGHRGVDAEALFHPDYEGKDTSEKHRPFSNADIEATLAELTWNSAPGRDKINHNTLRNLNDKAIDRLLKHPKKSWASGKIPAVWKHELRFFGYADNSLQEAVNNRDMYLRDCCLACDPGRSKLLVLKKRTRAGPEPDTPNPELTLSGLQKTVTQFTHLVRRVANRIHGLKEQDTLRMVQALVVSRITYGTPYLGLRTSEKEKISVLRRKTYMLAMGLPPTASTEKLLKLEVHNMLEDAVAAHRESQLERLSLNEAGRDMLRRLIRVGGESSKRKILLRLGGISSEYHGERRRAKVEALERMYAGKMESSMRYTHSAKNAKRGAYALNVVDGSWRELTTASSKTWIRDSVEEAAVDLAARTGRGCITILTNSQAACRNLQRAGSVTWCSRSLDGRRRERVRYAADVEGAASHLLLSLCGRDPSVAVGVCEVTFRFTCGRRLGRRALSCLPSMVCWDSSSITTPPVMPA